MARRTRVLRGVEWLIAVACGLALAACGPTDPDPSDGPEPSEEAERCVADGEDAPPSTTRDVLVGTGEGDAFVPFADGDVAALVMGQQGGYMIVPSVRVAAAPGDGDETCWNVRLDNTVSGISAEEVPDLLSRVKFERLGEHLQVDGMYDLLGYDDGPLVGSTLELTVTVTGHEFEGTRSVQLLLD